MLARGHVGGACRLPMRVHVARALHGLSVHDLPPPCLTLLLPCPAVSLGASVGAAGMLGQSGLEAASGIGAHGSVLGVGGDDAQVGGQWGEEAGAGSMSSGSTSGGNCRGMPAGNSWRTCCAGCV